MLSDPDDGHLISVADKPNNGILVRRREVCPGRDVCVCEVPVVAIFCATSEDGDSG